MFDDDLTQAKDTAWLNNTNFIKRKLHKNGRSYQEYSYFYCSRKGEKAGGPLWRTKPLMILLVDQIVLG